MEDGTEKFNNLPKMGSGRARILIYTFQVIKTVNQSKSALDCDSNLTRSYFTTKPL